MARRLAPALLVALAAALTVFAVWLEARSITFPLPAPDLILRLGKVMAFLAYFALVLQYAGTDKARLLEAILPFDRRVAIHRTLGIIAFLALVLHPVLVLGGYALWGAPYPLTFPLGMGLLALVLFGVAIGTAFLSRLWGVHYDTWKRLHWLVLPVLSLAFWHSILLGSDLQSGGLRPLWIGLWGLHVALLAGKAAHKLRAWSRTWTLRAVRPAGPQTVTLEIDRPPAPVRAGQFAFLSAQLAGRWQPWHPFSISSVTTDRIAMTVKGVGDFTSALAGLRAGDRVKLDLPYGGFTTDGLVPQAPVVMVAGGVGMAPLHGILEELAARPRPPAVTLVYSVHHESELLFRAEIEEWVRRVEGWRSVFVVTAQPEWRGERGRVTAERLAAWCGDDLHRATFFLCGPVGMLWAVRRGLRHRGIPRQRIRSEQFVFLP